MQTTTDNTNVSKVTITISNELKNKVDSLKDELHTSASAIHREALEYYFKQKEIQNWKEAAKLASQDEEYLAFVNDINDDGDIYEY